MSPKVMDTEARNRVAVERRSEQQILELIETLIGGWNRRDMTIFAAPFAEDVDFVTVSGEWIRGRRELADRYAERSRSSRLRADRISIRFLRPEVAVVHFAWEMAGETVRHGITTLTASQDRGRWQFDAAHNTDIVTQ